MRFAPPSRSPTSFCPKAHLVASIALGCGAWLQPHLAAADQTSTFEGEVPDGAPDHFFVPFQVPEGTQEIEIAHDDLSTDNILDFGLNDPNGYRGWGGGTSENAVVATTGASRAYLAGPIPAGEWKVVVGKAKIVAKPAKYKIVVTTKTAQAITPTTRTTYAPKTLKNEARYYAVDLHVHSKESTDASPTLDAAATFAERHGLDAIEFSDHNTVTQLGFYEAAQTAHPNLLLIPGIEFTTYAGHANAIGATQWVDHKIGQPGVTIEGAAAAFRTQGALFSINHPALDLGTLCIGCAWKHELSKEAIDAVEIQTGDVQGVAGLFTDASIDFWMKLVKAGRHVAAISGSDDHEGGGPDATSPIGHPTTMVYAKELSVAGIQEGIRSGRTVVKLSGPDDPMIELSSNVSPRGDTVSTKKVRVTAKVTKRIAGLTEFRFVKNGERQPNVAVKTDPFVATIELDAPPSGEDSLRGEVVIEGRLRTVTSHIFLTLGDDLPTPEPEGPSDDGCAAHTGTPFRLASVGAMGAIVALFALRRRRKARELA